MDNKVLLRKLVRPNINLTVTNITIGNRIPKEYFVTRGCGESDITIHAGSFHLALKSAGIEMCNIMSYSSILPSIAKEVKRPRILTHGSVMESIIASADAQKGERATSGIMYGWLFNKKTNEKYGGLVCEYHGDKSVKDASDQLRMSLYELYENGFSKNFKMSDIKLITESIVPRKKYGTALAALCFINYQVPVFGKFT